MPQKLGAGMLLAAHCVLPSRGAAQSAPPPAAPTSTEHPGGHDSSQLAKQTQNPGAPLLSVPLQLNFNGNIGSADQATVPLGAGVGKLFLLGHTPMNFSVQAYANVVRPDEGPTWQVRLTTQFLFPQPAGKRRQPE